MKISKLYLLLPLVWINLITAQDYTDLKAPEKSNTTTSQFENNWSFTAGVNIVDDSGNSLNNLFKFKENQAHNWAFQTPITIGAEYYFKEQFSFYAKASFNSFKPGKSIDGTIVDSESNPDFFAFDLGAKYSFRKLIKSETFDFYMGYGFGYTSIEEYINKKNQQEIQPKSRITGNASLGLNIWFTKNMALNMDAAAKFTYTSDASHYLQYNLAVVYLLSKK
ncbi:outer membrane beta-barrel protein [Tamlana agarivorans]|uniref:Outer membrane beta-barrel protein n=1 Tax=Pseudotamlana agarivorans TaxID=481183 RepID=A0ACC5U7E0_9FLAO|nr:outer membrane beta-barrel protein [Tamlana agarivorans]MBU2950229.1 outer membrane beta-barrel protein [Tamlana agarivorans]